MNQLLYLGAVSNDYDCGTYGSGGFNENQCAMQTAAPGTPDTGFGAVLTSPYLFVGVALIAAAVVLAAVMRRKRHAK